MSKIPIEQLLDNSFLGVPLYAIELYKTPINDKEFNAIRRRFFGICNELNCSALLVLSTHASNKNLKTVYNKRKKAGRPQKIVVGDVVPSHIHCAIVGKHAHKAATKSKIYFDKNYSTDNKKVSKIQCLSDTKCHSASYIGYCFRQADSVRTCGDFDFEKYAEYR